MIVGTCNSQNNPDLSRAQVRKIARIAGRHTDICGFQEIREHEDVLDTETGLGNGWDLWNKGVSVPIGLKSPRFEVLNHGKKLLSEKGGGFTPNRYVSYVIFNIKKRPGLGPVAITNGHLINKGPTNPSWDRMGHLTEEDKARLVKWEQGWGVWQNLVLDLVEEGYPTFIVGDMNRTRVRKFHNAQVWLDNSGIDKVGFVPSAGVDFNLLENIVVKTPSDHHLNAVRGNLVRK